MPVEDPVSLAENICSRALVSTAGKTENMLFSYHRTPPPVSDLPASALPNLLRIFLLYWCRMIICNSVQNQARQAGGRLGRNGDVCMKRPKDFQFHDLRHTFASQLIMRGGIVKEKSTSIFVLIFFQVLFYKPQKEGTNA